MNSIKDEILRRTNDGRDVFCHYFTIKSRGLFLNTYRSDTSPSCKLYYKNGRYIMVDYGASEWRGDCFHLVSKICDLDIRTQFVDILKVIDSELSLGIFDISGNRCLTPSQSHVPSVFHEEKKETSKFRLTSRDFTDNEKEYWGRYGITIDTLTKYNVRSISKCIVETGEKSFQVFGTSEQPSYAYMLNNGKGMKVYRPFSKSRFVYAGTLPSPYIFGYDQLPSDGKYLFITGGEKDVLSLAAHGFFAICFNSETINLPLSVITELSQRFETIIIMYDSDETGKKESCRQLDRMNESGFGNVKNLCLPLAGTKKEKDISDFFLLGHTSYNLLSLISKL